jgi:quercetin dioxygenase-like cupin family protein
MTMTPASHTRRAGPLVRTLLAAGVLGVLAVPASAGQCPAGKAGVDTRKEGPMAHSGVSDKVIASIDLAGEAPKLTDRKFRLRRLVVQPGGVVAWHSHEERPAIIYIVHNAGDVARETHTTRHWWKNTTRRPVVLLSADILHDKSDPKTM